MGNNKSKIDLGDKIMKIVIVGYSFGGKMIAEGL